MAKPEWGTKRTCQSCNARFYDLRRDPITCPSCGASYDPLALLRPKRGRAAALAQQDSRAPAPAEDELEVDEAEPAEEEEETTLETIDEEEEEDQDLIEDASELGEDDDDMSEVIDGVEEEGDEER